MVSELSLDKHGAPQRGTRAMGPRPGNQTAKDSGVVPRELSGLQGL